MKMVLRLMEMNNQLNEDQLTMHRLYQFLSNAKNQLERYLLLIEQFFEEVNDEMMTMMQENEQMKKIDDTIDIHHPYL